MRLYPAAIAHLDFIFPGVLLKEIQGADKTLTLYQAIKKL